MGKFSKKTMSLLFILVFLLGCSSKHTDPIEITQIKVWDSEFNVLMIINKGSQLDAINQSWQELELIEDLPNTNWTHKLDIIANHSGGRYLYNEDGYIAKLNYQLEPAYHIKDPAAFQNIIFDFQELDEKQDSRGVK